MARTPAADPTVGDVIDRRYLLRREIARGGMGAVFEAEQQGTGRTVAVKLVHRRTRYAHISEERLLREARAISAARHPGIVEILDAGVCDRAGPFIALEMLIGRTLDGIIAARRTLPIADVVHIGRQMCEALGFVHELGIVHRDLKPSNVFVVRDARRELVKLFDFGIAALDERHERKLTAVSEMIGTPEYMAPEQLFDEGKTDHRCDVYAVGVTLYECLTGDVPYSGEFHQVLTKLARAKVAPSVSAVRAEVPSELSEVVEVALAKDPSSRFASARALSAALVAATGLAVGSSTLLRGAGPSVPPKSRPSDRPDADSAPIPLVRRLFERVPYVTLAEVEYQGAVLEGRSEDISLGGMLVRTLGSLPPQAEVTVRFALPTTNERIGLAATIRWSRAARGGGFAIGVEFRELPLEARRVIASYIQQP